MSKNQRKMIFIFCVGIALYLFWPLFEKYVEDSTYFFAELNMVLAPIILLFIFNAKLNLIATILVTLCSICLSPILWMFVGFELNNDFLYNSFFDSYSILCITATLLLCLSAEELCIRYSKPKTNSCMDSCTVCGSGLFERQLFCSNCHAISPKVKDTLNRFPNKVYLDFATDNTDHILCPNCKEIIRTINRLPIGQVSLGIPLQFCDNCQNVYLDSDECEWFGLPLRKKILLCLFWGPHSLFCLVFLGMQTSGDISVKACLILCLIVTLLRIIWFFTITVFDIRKSEARLKANPEYPYLLIKMGYQHFSEDYKNLHK